MTRMTFIKSLCFVLLTFLAFTSYGQTYTRPNSAYGSVQYRLKTDSVLHLPAINDTLAHTTDTSAQIRVYQGDLYYKWGYWRKASGSVASLQALTDGEGGNSVTTGNVTVNNLTASNNIFTTNIEATGTVTGGSFYGNGAALTNITPDSLQFVKWNRLYKAIDSIGAIVPIIIDKQGAGSAVTVSSTSSADIYSVVVAANSLASGKGMTIRCLLTHLNNSGSTNTHTIGLTLEGTVVATRTYNQISRSTNVDYDVTFEIYNEAGTIKIRGIVAQLAGSGVTTANGGVPSLLTYTPPDVSFTSSSSNTFAITVQNSVSNASTSSTRIFAKTIIE